MVTEHAEYTELGDNLIARAAVYAQLFDEGLEDAALRDIRQSVDRCDPYGSDEFKRKVESGQLEVISEIRNAPNGIKRFQS